MKKQLKKLEAALILSGLLSISPVILAQETPAPETPTTETPATEIATADVSAFAEMFAKLDLLRAQQQNDPEVAVLHEQATALRAQLKENPWDAETIAQLDILHQQMTQVQNQDLAAQMTELRAELRALMQAEGSFGRPQNNQFVDMDGDGVNDGFQHGRGVRAGIGFGMRALARIDKVYNDTDSDGTIDEVLVDTNADGTGDVTLQAYLEDLWTAMDENGDGVPDKKHRGVGFAFGQKGIVQIAKVYNDTDGDGVIDEILVDNNGDGAGDVTLEAYLKTVWESMDENGDGTPDKARGVFGFNGRFMAGADKIYNDTDGDGRIDEILVDVDGNGSGDISLQEHLKAAWIAMDADGDGIPDVRAGARGGAKGDVNAGAGHGIREGEPYPDQTEADADAKARIEGRIHLRRGGN